MAKLTKNISRHEMACHCGCGFDTMDWETVRVLQDCADHYAEIRGLDRSVVTITSAARCLDYNRSIGSTDNSQHPRGRAIDFTIAGVRPHDVYAYLADEYPDRYGIGNYSNFTHLDTRSGGPARW